jgi:glycosyltransferase involved in cell wall biosynthesis
VVEAMASNLPVIITNRVGISDIILQGDAGIVTSCDVPELVNAVVKLVEDLDFRTQMSGKALKLAKAEFDVEVMGNNMSTIFTDIVKGQQ